MFVVIRTFRKLRSVSAAAQRAQTGLVERLRQMPGFIGYHIFDGGDGAGGSVSFFSDEQSATAANERSVEWISASLADLCDGEPEVLVGEILYSAVGPHRSLQPSPSGSQQASAG